MCVCVHVCVKQDMCGVSAQMGCYALATMHLLLVRLVQLYCCFPRTRIGRLVLPVLPVANAAFDTALYFLCTFVLMQGLAAFAPNRLEVRATAGRKAVQAGISATCNRTWAHSSTAASKQPVGSHTSQYTSNGH